jgi:hypothetical protein
LPLETCKKLYKGLARISYEGEDTMSGNVVVVIHRGRLFRIPKIPFETEEQAYVRAWYIAQHYGEQPYATLQSTASQNMYKQFYGMQY